MKEQEKTAKIGAKNLRKLNKNKKD